jgi:maltooligosyltrehalose trehalohydrolase
VLTGETNGYYADFGRIEHIARALTNGFVYVGEHSISRKRKHGRPLGDTSGHKLLAYLQTHDQVGNRARGERLGHLVPEGLARIGAALLFVSPFVPMLFQGEEWGSSAPFQYFTDHQDPELAEAVRRGRREEFRAFGWDPEQVPDPQAESTFRRSKLRWEERDHSPYRERLNFYRALIRLRRDTPDLLGGRRERVEVSFDEDERWLRVTRGSICVVVNFAEQPRALPTPPGVLVLSSTDEPPRTAGSSLTAAAQSCYMFRC